MLHMLLIEYVQKINLPRLMLFLFDAILLQKMFLFEF